MKSTLLRIVLSTTVALFAAAAVEFEPVRIDRIAWLAGTWKGQAFGGEVEEIWSRPNGGTMMGMFRLLEKGKTVFTEFEQIVEQDNSLVFKVKHFTPAFVGWEEKDKTVDFKLLAAQENEVRFDGLTIALIDADTCKHVIRLKDKETRQEKDVEIIYRRVKD